LENNLDVSWNNYLNTVKNNKEINNITNYLKEITIGNKIKSFTSWLVDAANKLQVEKLNDFVPET
jgi:hypothetical protein